MENAEVTSSHPDLSPSDVPPLPTDVSGVQATPTSPSEPVRLDEADHLKYQLLGSRVDNTELKITMYERELQHARIERENLRQDVTAHVRHIEAKYGTNLMLHAVSADGYLLPRDLGQRNALKRS